MSKKKDIRSCPNCGSRNLQTENRSKKGRKLYICAECDHEFELRPVNGSDHKGRERQQSNQY